MIKIYLDPGHGGTDSGAVGYGLMEKFLTLAIALRLRDILLHEYEGIQVRMSRTTDKTLSLDQRTDDANAWGADYLCSIHINAGGGIGFEIHTYDGDYNGKAETNHVAELIHDAIVEATGFVDRDCKESNFHMVRESKMKSSLTENGFIDNEHDAARLKSDSFLDRIARGHAKGFERALNLRAKPKKQTLSNNPPSPSNDHLYVLESGNLGTFERATNDLEKLRNHPIFKDWILHLKVNKLIDPDRIVILTGSVKGESVAEYFCIKMKEYLGYKDLYIKEVK